MLSDCPVCKKTHCLEINNKTENIPYFGEVMTSTFQCRECGFRNADIICLEQKKPVKCTLQVDQSKLNTRIIKSQSATISIPELGLKVEPGPQSQGYISNVEGVLVRFENALKTALNWSEDDQIKKNAINLLDELELIKKDEKKVTLVVEDPFGHSMIGTDEAQCRELTDEELKKLKTGFIILDK